MTGQSKAPKRFPVKLGIATAGALLVAASAVPAATGSSLGDLAGRVASMMEPGGSQAMASIGGAQGGGAVMGRASQERARAIQTVIQRANDEQQRAYAQGDPTLMRDTATDAYYQELAQNQHDLQQAGVSAIRLVQLEWGTITVNGDAAQATTYETWVTSFGGRSTQSRDRNVYTLVQQNGAWVIQADEHPDAEGGSSSGPAPSGSSGSRGGSGPSPSRASTSGQSENWSGYAATGGDFTSVSGSWVVPQVTASTSSGADATWVGIGGVTSHDLIQVGTDATVAGSRVRYTAWIETLPQAARTVPLMVHAGDAVSVSITLQSSNTWQVAIHNDTTGQNYQQSVTYSSSRSSAEWVEEAPSSGRSVAPLDDFGTVQFLRGATIKDGRNETIASAGGRAITMINSRGQVLAQTSALGSDGASFTVARTGAGAAVSSPAVGGRSTGTGRPRSRGFVGSGA